LGQQAETLSAEVAHLRKDSAQLSKDREEARIALQTARSDLNDEQDELKRVQSALRSARAELETAQLGSDQLRTVVGATRLKPLVFQYGQEVRRLQCGTNLSEQAAQSAVNKLLADADKAARERGAVTAPGSLLSVFFPTIENSEDPAELRDAIVQSIAGQDHETVLIAQAFVNTFQGEPVPIHVINLANPIVYHKDEVLAELKVGRNWTEARVWSEFNDFMNRQVRDKIKDKMIPIAGQQASMVELAPAKTIAVVERLTRSPRDTVLQVTCLAETRAADSLQLDFKYK
jgi:hypothetical protein